VNESNICASGATLGDEVIPAEAVVSTASKALTLARRANCKWPTRALTYPLWGCEVILHDEGVFACAAGYVGRKRHASFRHRFPSVDARTTFIEAWVAKHRAEAEAAALEKEIVSKARAEKPAFAVGDVLYSTWGWEQTNVDFYQVVAVNGACISVQELRSSQTPQDTVHFTDRGKCVPLKDQFLPGSEPVTVRPRYYLATPTTGAAGSGERTVCAVVKIDKHLASPWDGKPVAYSDYA
jgi:hypothetical protein